MKIQRLITLALCMGCVESLVTVAQAQYSPETKFAKGMERLQLRVVLFDSNLRERSHGYYNMLMDNKEGRVHNGGPVYCNKLVSEGFGNEVCVHIQLFNDEFVTLPHWLNAYVKDLNEQLRQKLSPVDYLEILKGEQAMAVYYTSLAEFKQDHGDNLKLKLQAILQEPSDKKVFARAMFLGGDAATPVTLKSNLRNLVGNIVYADEKYVVTQEKGVFAEGSATLTFWSNSTYEKVATFAMPTFLGSKATIVTAQESGIYLIRPEKGYGPCSTRNWCGELWCSYMVDPEKKKHQTIYGDGTGSIEMKKQREGGELFRLFEAAAEKNGLTKSGVSSNSHLTSAGISTGGGTTVYPLSRYSDSIAYEAEVGRVMRLNLHTLSESPIARTDVGDSDREMEMKIQLKSYLHANVCGAKPSLKNSNRPQSLAAMLGNAEERRKADALLEALSASAAEHTGREISESDITLRYMSYDEHLCSFAHEPSGRVAFHASHLRAADARGDFDTKHAGGITAIRDKQGDVIVLPALPRMAKIGASGSLRKLSAIPHRANPAPGSGEHNDYLAPASAQYYDFGESNDGGLNVRSVHLTADEDSSVCYLSICAETSADQASVWVLRVDFSAETAQTIYYSDSTSLSGLPIVVPEPGCILLPRSVQSYEMIKISSDATVTKVADLHFSPGQGYAVVLPDGRFAGTPGCERFLEYNTPQGSFDMTLFASRFNRPGDVLEALDGNPADIKALKMATKRWLGKDPGEISHQLPAMPEATLLSPVESEATDATLLLNIELQASSKIAITGLRVFVDGVRVAQPYENTLCVRPGCKQSVQVSVPLSDGQNNVQIYPEDSMGTPGKSINFSTIYNTTETPRLYLVTLGVSDYANDELDLQYAAKDARDIAAAVKECSYLEPRILNLTDAEVPDAGVLDKVRAFLADSRPDDTIIFYLAGHGMLDERLEYYYAPHHFDVDNIKETGISMNAITDCLQNTASQNRLLLLDTCHSGTVGEAEMDQLAANGVQLPHGVRAIANRGMKIKKASNAATVDTGSKKRYIEEFFSRSSSVRGIAILSAASGSQFAQESSEWNNGLFTATLIDAIRNACKGDMDLNGRLSIAELVRWLEREIVSRTAGLQVPNANVGEGSSLSYLPFRYPNPPLADGLKLKGFNGLWDRNTAEEFAQLLPQAMECPKERNFAGLFDGFIELPELSKTVPLFEFRKAHFKNMQLKGTPRVEIEHYVYKGDEIRLVAHIAYKSDKNFTAHPKPKLCLITARINEKGRICSWQIQETNDETIDLPPNANGPFVPHKKTGSFGGYTNRTYFNVPEDKYAPEESPGYVFIPAKKFAFASVDSALYQYGVNGYISDELAIAWANRFIAVFSQNNEKHLQAMLTEEPIGANYITYKEDILKFYEGLITKWPKRKIEQEILAREPYYIHLVVKLTCTDVAGQSISQRVYFTLNINSDGTLCRLIIKDADQTTADSFARKKNIEIVSGTGKNLYKPDAQGYLTNEQAHVWGKRIQEAFSMSNSYFDTDFVNVFFADTVNGTKTKEDLKMQFRSFAEDYKEINLELSRIGKAPGKLQIIVRAAITEQAEDDSNDIPLSVSDDASSSSDDDMSPYGYSCSFTEQTNITHYGYRLYDLGIDSNGKIHQFKVEGFIDDEKPDLATGMQEVPL